MSSIAKVVVDIALDREFDYLIPANLKDSIRLGTRVVVPFGKSRRSGYVVGFLSQSDRKDLKKIAGLAGEKPFIDERMLKLARWMSEYYCAPVEKAIRTVLPGAVRRKGAGFRKQMYVSLSSESETNVESRRRRDKCRACPAKGGVPNADLNEKEAGKTRKHSKTSKRGAGISTLPPKQKTVLEILRSKGGMFLDQLTKEAGITASPVRALEKRGLVRIEPAHLRRDPLANRTVLRTEPLHLMREQAEALTQIKECIAVAALQGGGAKPCGHSRPTNVVGVNCRAGMPERSTNCPPGKSGISPSVVLLYGVTGSGKTEVYLQAIDYVLKKGQGAIMLVPEISLTPQTVERFLARFGNRIAVLHSYLSEGERHDEWHRIHDGKADIVIGARSAVFAPVRNLGLIVVDEEHEPSYKQEDAPRYSARDVAVMRGRMENCAVVLGSATPSLESWFNARISKYWLATLPHRADNRKMPVMRVIDMRIETERSGHVCVFSKQLFEAIHRRLDRAEQTILFLNRRGFATSLICRKCGHVARCDQCSVSYTYHRATRFHSGAAGRKNEELRCHICGASRKVPRRCPCCQDPAFRFAGIGTQRVEDIAKKCFPHARIQRMDTDVTTRKDSYDRILGDFRVGKIDILIGTQMIAKGLHFPNVTLVGVIYADLSLHMPDFRAGERTFQLLAQVAGRAGRGEVSGEVIVQTYTPFHMAIQAARRLDYEGFCDQEVEFRRELSYPPFTHLICITLRGPSEEKVSFCSQALAGKLKRKLSRRVILAQPAPAPLARAKGLYRYQVMLRCASTRLMTEAIKEALHDFRFPPKMTCSVDVDAISLL